MTAAGWALDGLLACSLPLLAWQIAASGSLSRAVVLFIASGSLSAIAWTRLDAPDLALVEAAVGAGLTGALLMSTLGWVGPERAPTSPARPVARAALPGLLAVLAAGLGAVVLELPGSSPGLRDPVAAGLPGSGVSHPVTAVLLNFRGYDTLLEIAVLLVAGILVLGLRGPGAGRDAGDEVDPAGPLLPVLVRLLVPGMVLVAGYLLWRGSHAPGGAFQAGAILGAGGGLLLLARTVRPPAPTSPLLRAGLVAGPCVFVTVAASALVAGRSLLEYPPAWAGALILLIESALAVSIALVLTAFLLGVGRQEPGPGEELP